MKQITVSDLEFLSLGSALLGSGGGGDPTYAFLMAKHQIEQYGPINVLSIEELKAEDVVVPLAIMGAPLINTERVVNGRELETLLKTLQTRLGLRPTVLMAGEIGGANAFTPLLIAAKLGLPILDADLIGRAFPELQMNVCCLQKLSATPAIVADCLGNAVVIETTNLKTLEKFARAITVSMGSSAAIALHIMNGCQAQQSVIPGTLSQAIALGKIIYQARENRINPVSLLAQQSYVQILGQGTLIDIQQEVRDGFLYGSAYLQGENGKIQLLYQNEYLLASDHTKVLASTPDIIMILEESSGSPITSESLKYGLQVSLIAIAAPAIWQTPEGLTLVGPSVFGYEIDYQPIQLSEVKA